MSQITDNNHIATTRILTRVLVCLGEQKKPVNHQIIRKYMDCNRNKLQDALLWLTNHKLIIKTKTNGDCSVYKNADWI